MDREVRGARSEVRHLLGAGKATQFNVSFFGSSPARPNGAQCDGPGRKPWVPVPAIESPEGAKLGDCAHSGLTENGGLTQGLRPGLLPLRQHTCLIPGRPLAGTDRREAAAMAAWR